VGIGGLTMAKLELSPCRKCKTTEKLIVITFLGAMCKVVCSKCGTATKWQKSVREAEDDWNRRNRK
jgi:hypothetical protein